MARFRAARDASAEADSMNRLFEFFAAKKTDAVTGARIIPTWKAGRPLASRQNLALLAEEGYRKNVLSAACIWAISTSAAEPELIVERVKKDGTTEIAQGPDAEALRALLETPNPEHSIYFFLERLFVDQQITGNWFFRKIRNNLGLPVQLWPMRSEDMKIVPNANGWVERYTFGATNIAFPAKDVVHDPLHPDPQDDFWGMSPIEVAGRFLDIDNQAADFLRAFFTNNATPAGLLKLKAKVDPAERRRLKDLWQTEHSGTQGWQTTSVLDADADYEAIGTDMSKFSMEAIWNETETRICMAFGVPPIVVAAVVGLNRSTFANFAEARRAFWNDTLAPLYKRCGQRLTKGVAVEFGADLRIRFDLSKVSALQENQDAKRKFVLDAYNAGVFTLDEALQELGRPTVGGDEGGKRKAPAPSPFGFPTPEDGKPNNSGLAKLLGKEDERRGTHEHHGRKLSKEERAALKSIQDAMAEHFKEQGKSLATHLK